MKIVSANIRQAMATSSKPASSILRIRSSARCGREARPINLGKKQSPPTLKHEKMLILQGGKSITLLIA